MPTKTLAESIRDDLRILNESGEQTYTVCLETVWWYTLEHSAEEDEEYANDPDEWEEAFPEGGYLPYEEKHGGFNPCPRPANIHPYFAHYYYLGFKKQFAADNPAHAVAQAREEMGKLMKAGTWPPTAGWEEGLETQSGEPEDKDIITASYVEDQQGNRIKMGIDQPAKAAPTVNPNPNGLAVGDRVLISDKGFGLIKSIDGTSAELEFDNGSTASYYLPTLKKAERANLRVVK